MKFGFVVPNNFGISDPGILVELGQHAEAIGFDSVWVNHHVLHLGYVEERLNGTPYHDALMTLSWIGAATHEVKLGTSVLVMPYLHPMVLAKELATLDHLTKGRLVVGLGVGSLPEENEALGVPYSSRGRYSNEFIQVLKLLWTQDQPSFSGEFFSFTNLRTSPKPLQQPHPPILTGGNRPPALRRAATFADGWHGLNLGPDSVRKRRLVLNQEADKIGRTELDNISLRLDMRQLDQQKLADYRSAGVTELVVSLNSAEPDEQRQAMESFAATFF